MYSKKIRNYEFRRAASIIYYLETLFSWLSHLPSLVPMAHFTLPPCGALVSFVSFVLFSCSRIALFLLIHNTLLATEVFSLLGRLRIFSRSLTNIFPCSGLVKKSPSMSYVGHMCTCCLMYCHSQPVRSCFYCLSRWW